MIRRDRGWCFTGCSQVSKQQPRGASRAYRNLRAILMKPEILFKTFIERTPASVRSHLWTWITLSLCWLRLAFLPVRTAFQNDDTFKNPKTKSQNASHQLPSQRANTGTVIAKPDYKVFLQEHLHGPARRVRATPAKIYSLPPWFHREHACMAQRLLNYRTINY